MVISILIQVVYATTQLLIFLIIASVVLSYFMPPYHQVRQAIDRIVEPMLMPVRRVVPLLGMLDFSPFILIILIQILSGAIRSFLRGLL